MSPLWRLGTIMNYGGIFTLGLAPSVAGSFKGLQLRRLVRLPRKEELLPNLLVLLLLGF